MHFLLDSCLRHKSVKINETAESDEIGGPFLTPLLQISEPVSVQFQEGTVATSVALDWISCDSETRRVFSKGQGLYLKASPRVVSAADRVLEKSKIILYSVPCTLAKAHTKKQNEDLMVWLGEIIYSYTRWWSALLWSSDLCLAMCLFKTLRVSSCNICLRNMIGVRLVCSFSCGSQGTSQRQYL